MNGSIVEGEEDHVATFVVNKTIFSYPNRFLDKMIKIVMLLLIYSSHSVLYKPENPITHSASIMHLWSKHFQL